MLRKLYVKVGGFRCGPAVEKKYFFSTAAFSKLKASNRLRFFSRTRYGSKDEVLYIGCYNQVVWDTENPSILDSVKSKMIGLGGQCSLPP